MLKRNFFILAIMVLGIGMVIRAFFGGNPNSDNIIIPQDTNTGFVEIINNTGNILDIPTTPTSSSENQYTEIKVMMPKYFYNSGWKKFAEDLYDRYNIYINFIFIDDLNSYRDQLYTTNFSDADFFLYPYDRNQKISTKSFSSEQNIQSYFDQLLYPITQDTKISFIPFAADPMVTYTLSGLSAYNFYEISELVFNREPTVPLSFPLFFGINTEDLEKNGFSREYQDILRYALLHYFETNHDSMSLNLRINTNVLEKYNIPDLNTISKAISEPKCKLFPSLCFQLYNFVGMRFGFLSDRDIVNTYFIGKKSNFENLSINSVPFSQLETPVRIRGRGIRGSLDDTPKIKAIYTLIEQYMDKHNDYNLRNSTLPVFNTNEGNGLIYNQYIGMRGYALLAGGDYINSLREIDDFWKLIGYKNEMTAKEYLK